jgi:hypothetical protein
MYKNIVNCLYLVDYLCDFYFITISCVKDKDDTYNENKGKDKLFNLEKSIIMER